MKFPKFLKRKRNIWIIAIVIVLIIIGYFIFSPKNNTGSIQTGFVTEQNLQETVLSTGQVVSGTNLNLSFQEGGIVRQVLAAAGGNVSAGQTLAVLDQSSAKAALTSAEGSLAQAQANYEKLLAGATAETIQTSQDSVNSSKQNLTNAYNGGINTLNNAYTAIYNAYNVAVSMQNNYFTTQDPQGIAVSNAKDDINTNMQSTQTSLTAAEKSMQPSDIDSATTQTISALNNVYDDVNTIRAQCDQGIYYYKVSATDKATLDAQKTAVNAALTGATALQQSIASLKLALQTAEDQLSVTTAAPTQDSIDLAKAQILSAQGQVDSAQAVVNNTILSAPFAGQIDKDNIVVGQIASPNVPVITISNSNLEIDTSIPEVDLPNAKVGGKANITLDTFGNGVIFPATIFSVDLSPTVANGISTYGAKLKFDSSDNRIDPGMTANITIISDTHSNVLLVPISAVIQNNNEYFVVIDKGNSQKETIQVKVGLSDGKNIEIISGLKLGEKVFAY
jgi:HlyD family secretion protein